MPISKGEQLSFNDDWPIQTPPQSSIDYADLKGHIWTNTKAKLIRNYLNYFQWVTKHGCYIDGFSGPQYQDEGESWAANLVLDMEPKWFRQFFLCELNRNKFRTLKNMVDEQPEKKNRTIVTHKGDVNIWVEEVLNSGVISDSVATFALLDQHTNQCHWRTVEILANHKQGSTKIELFYFYPTSWVNRSISKKNEAELDNWWGDDGWKEVKNLTPAESMQLMHSKIKNLGYLDVSILPIYKKEDGGQILYHMIHATDHPDARKLMTRAYQKLVATPEELETIDMWEEQNLVGSE